MPLILEKALISITLLPFKTSNKLIAVLHFSIFSVVHQNKEAFLTKLRLYSIKLIVIYPHKMREIYQKQQKTKQ